MSTLPQVLTLLPEEVTCIIRHLEGHVKWYNFWETQAEHAGSKDFYKQQRTKLENILNQLNGQMRT